MSRDKVTVADVHIAALRIQNFVAGNSKEEFLEDFLLQSAVIHQLLIIGEAIKRLSTDFCQAHKEVNWKEYAGFRDVLIHRYNEVNLDEVWDSVEIDLPKLIILIEPLLPPPLNDSNDG